jgi:hypothetical protein
MFNPPKTTRAMVTKTIGKNFLFISHAAGAWSQEEKESKKLNHFDKKYMV